MVHGARMIYNALRQNEKESLQDYYSRTMRSIATQVSLGYKPDADIDQAMDFTYKLERKLFQTMITNMDWIEEAEIRKYEVALRADSTIVYVTKISIEPTHTKLGMGKLQQAQLQIIARPYSPTELATKKVIRERKKRER